MEVHAARSEWWGSPRIAPNRSTTIIELTPEGAIVTYGVGVSLDADARTGSRSADTGGADTDRWYQP
jgi:hypothetical protein